ncbi:hypothetical protein BDW67DRAFT_165823 [Aspergillus spinulosporus]
MSVTQAVYTIAQIQHVRVLYGNLIDYLYSCVWLNYGSIPFPALTLAHPGSNPIDPLVIQVLYATCLLSLMVRAIISEYLQIQFGRQSACIPWVRRAPLQ